MTVSARSPLQTQKIQHNCRVDTAYLRWVAQIWLQWAGEHFIFWASSLGLTLYLHWITLLIMMDIMAGIIKLVW